MQFKWLSIRKILDDFRFNQPVEMPIKPIKNSKNQLEGKNFGYVIGKFIFWAVETLWFFFSYLFLISQLLIVRSKEHSHVHALANKCFY